MPLIHLNPVAARAAILAIELTVFFTATVAATYLLSHAGALVFAKGDAPPASFPVIAYDGDPARPDPKGYVVAAWDEWAGVAAKRPGANLLLPERSGSIRLDDRSLASFTAEPDGAARQQVELKWTGSGSEQHVRYVTHGRDVEPLYYRRVGTNTFLMGAIVGFICGMLTGRSIRRRWLRPPGAVIQVSRK